MAYPPHPCPRCRRSLDATGTVDVDGKLFPVYQCDSCVVPFSLEGESFDAALTFAVDRAGRALDPESLEPLPLAPPSDRPPSAGGSRSAK